MLYVKLPKEDSEKIAHSIRIYQSTMDKVHELSDCTAISVPNLMRIAIHNLLNSEEAIKAVEQNK